MAKNGLVSILTGYETRNAHLSLRTVGGQSLVGHIAGGNREVLMFRTDEKTAAWTVDYQPPATIPSKVVNVPLTSIDTIEEID